MTEILGTVAIVMQNSLSVLIGLCAFGSIVWAIEIYKENEKERNRSNRS